MKVRGVLITVLAVAVLANGALLWDAVFGGGWLSVAMAGNAMAEERTEKPHGPAAGVLKTAAADKAQLPTDASATAAREAELAYRALVTELTEQKQVLDAKAKELAERERQVGVLRQELQAQKDQAADAGPAPAAAGAKGPATEPGESFKKLVKAYAGMEAENAARALQELYVKDRDTALDVILGLPARKAAAIMDALAASKPSLAADLSSEMSHRDEPRAQ
jgi:hypothetical protein